MTRNRVLEISSCFAILLMTLHLADDIVLGLERGGLPNLIALPILVTWLLGTLLLASRRTGLVIVLLGSLFGAAVPFVHFKAAGGVVACVPGGGLHSFWFVWSLILLGITSLSSGVVATIGLFEFFVSRDQREA